MLYVLPVLKKPQWPSLTLRGYCLHSMCNPLINMIWDCSSNWCFLGESRGPQVHYAKLQAKHQSSYEDKFGMFHSLHQVHLFACIAENQRHDRNRADKRPTRYEPNHEPRNTSKSKGHRGAKGKGFAGRSSMPSQKGKGKGKSKGNAKGKSKGMYLIHSILISHLEYVIV